MHLPDPSRGGLPETMAPTTQGRFFTISQIRLADEITGIHTPGTTGAPWDSRNNRFYGGFGRLRSKLLGPRIARAGFRRHWSERLIDLLVWPTLVLILAAFLFVVYRALQLSGLL